MKKITLIFLLCSAPILHAATYNGTCGANMNWSLDTSVGDLLITGSGEMDTYSNGSHAPWSNYRQYVRRVLMDDAITSVGDYAFDGCTNLWYIYFPVELTSGGRLAVNGCSSLKEVCWNARHLTSYYGPLNQASSVEKMVFGDSVRVIEGAVVPVRPNRLRRVEFGPNIAQIENYAFSSCDALDTIVWNVRRYTANVRYGSQAPLRCIIIGDSVRYLGNATAHSNAHKIRVPRDVDTIHHSAFARYAFGEDSNLDTIIWAAKAPYIIRESITSFEPGRLFDGHLDHIQAIIFEDGVQVIPANMCEGMKRVEELHLPLTVDSIGEWAFALMSNLKRVNIPYNLKSADNTLFNNCNSLQHIRWEAADCRLGEDGSSPFSTRVQDRLQTWTFGDSVRVIPAKLCQWENAIKDLRIPASVDCIGQDAFLYCNALERIVVDEANTHYDSRENCDALIYSASDSLIRGAQNTRIPESVKIIAPNAFRRLNHLNWAELKNPDVQIGDRAFFDIAQLDSIYWNVRTMPETPFYDLLSENSFTYDGTTFFLISFETNHKVRYCQFGDSVHHIPANFCREMNLQEIYLPYALQSIGNYAFWCDSLLNIYCAADIPAEGYSTFAINKGAIVHVPCGTSRAYKSHDVWGHFENIVEEDDNGQPCSFVGLENIINDQPHAAQKIIRDGQLFIHRDGKIYNLTGEKIK